MAVTAYSHPGTVSGANWAATDAGTLVHAVSASDEVWAKNNGPVTDYLILSNFSFALPLNAVVEGIEVSVEASGTDAMIFGQNRYLGVFTSKDAVTPLNSDERQFAINGTPPPDVTQLLGGAVDLWSGGWLYNEINDAGFAFFIRAGSSSTDQGNPNCNRRVDEFKVRVYYSEDSGGSGTIMMADRGMRRIPPDGSCKSRTSGLRK